LVAVEAPSHPPFLCGCLDVAVALGGDGLCVGAEHGIGAGRNHHHRSRIALIQGGATPEVIALAVSRALDLGETDTSEAREIRASLRVLSDLHGMGGAVEDKIGRYPGSA
jgi:hypothetical protein